MKLKELMDEDLTQMSQEKKDKFFDKLKESELLLPVEVFVEKENLDNITPVMIKTHNGRVITPLFTDVDEINDEAIITISFKTFDIVTILDQFKVDGVIINPFSKNLIAIGVDTLVQLFISFDTMVDELRTLLRSNSTTLANDTEIYIRTREPFKEPFSPKIPINASSNKNFKEELPCLNILRLSKGDKIMYVGDVVNEKEHPDIVIAPDTKFELVEQNGDEFIWKCINQPFYNE
ncbi:MAG: SseB family protein [Methanobrevibacter sp.]|mgnify:CR=1 FL=1|nr:SseB family protein [Methanobrevibacter sp.]